VKRLGDLGALRAQRVTALRDLDKAAGKVAMKAGEGGLSGKLVIEAENLTKAYDGRIIVDHFSTRILRGDRVGITGANGAGKTTLLNMLTGKTKPDSGHIRLGAGLEMVSLDQRRDQLDPALTLRETLTGGGSDMIPVAGEKKHVVAYMKDFLFTPEQAGTPISELSGGERGRVMLALALAKPSNLLVLDEPTNDLDLETLELLQELLSGYRGTVLLISHDRDFLDRTVTSVISTSGNGVWTEYAGGFSQSIKAAKGETGGARRKLQSKQRPSSSPPAAASSARKLSFREKHALETLPKRMDELEKAVETFKQALSDTQLFAKDPERYNRLAENLARAERELQRAEEQWLELEMLREEIEGDRAG
ncbi:MAG TPA: ATP-binding cassette domain-containing protein, partial [Rhizobiales bacterium]|nr:ATP-binding cassette domain-containing protein [Hyphomicrobiales bacterium]